MPAPTLRGRFVWHELMTTDPDAAARFYPGVTGWKVQAWEQDPSYRLWMTGSVLRGGLMRLPEESRRLGAPPSWLMYVGVPPPQCISPVRSRPPAAANFSSSSDSNASMYASYLLRGLEVTFMKQAQ